MFTQDLAVKITVRAAPLIAGKAPVRAADVNDVRAAPLIAGKSPVRAADVKEVRPEPFPVGVSTPEGVTLSERLAIIILLLALQATLL
jgi:hypothetical protein